MRKIAGLLVCGWLAAAGFIPPASAQQGSNQIGINVLLKVPATPAVLADLGRFGTVRDIMPEIQAVTIQAPANQLAAIQALSYVAAANPDAERNGAPVDTVAVTNFAQGWSTWDLDAINVTDLGAGRTIAYDGAGVYVAVLDSGLLDSWRQYFPQERISVQYARSFGGGGGLAGTVSSQPNKWEHDQDSHGTHVTSTILGYNFGGVAFNGVAPMATVIPVKVLNQNGSGWSSVIARGILYVAGLKAGELKNSPVVVNMSLGGRTLDPTEKTAIDYAVAQGVIIVASAGNNGTAGMGYPGAYDPVISVAASGWVGEWTSGDWWYAQDVSDPTNAADFYIADFSSREKPGQHLDVAAPGSWILGPYQTNSGQISMYFLGGTSMASPHVAGTVALMAQKDPGLTAADAHALLKSTAIPLPAGCRTVAGAEVCWTSDATGAGLVDASAALDAAPAPLSGRNRPKAH